MKKVWIECQFTLPLLYNRSHILVSPFTTLITSSGWGQRCPFWFRIAQGFHWLEFLRFIYFLSPRLNDLLVLLWLLKLMFPSFPKALVMMELSALMKEQNQVLAGRSGSSALWSTLRCPRNCLPSGKTTELIVTFKVIVKISLSTHWIHLSWMKSSEVFF